MLKKLLAFLGITACTILLYHWAFDKHSELYYWNVVITCISEGILMFNLRLFNTEPLFLFRNKKTYLLINGFSVAHFLFVTLYTLAIADGKNIQILYVGVSLLNTLYFILFAYLEAGHLLLNRKKPQKSSEDEDPEEEEPLP